MKRKQLVAVSKAGTAAGDRANDVRGYVCRQFRWEEVGITVEDTTWPVIPGDWRTLGERIRHVIHNTLQGLQDET